eukprot:1191765-Prorocentrum_minimum.AAC.3
MPNAILNPKPPEVEREMRNVTWFVRAKGQASAGRYNLRGAFASDNSNKLCRWRFDWRRCCTED